MTDLSGFTASTQGQKALQQLQGHGFSGHQAQAMLGAAVPAAAEAMQRISKGDTTLPSFSESNYVMNFTAGAVSGLIRGQGFMGSAIDGIQGMVGGYVAQIIAARFGLPKRTAGIIGAVITPLAIDFIWAKLGGAVNQQQQLPPAQAPAQLPAGAHYAPAHAPPRGYGYVTQASGGPGYVPSYQGGPGYYPPGGVARSLQAPPGYAPGAGRYTPGRGYRR
jgi:hypothetical protein